MARHASRPSSGQVTAPTAASEQPKSEALEIPLGIAAALPGEDLEGTLIPEVKLVFDSVPDAVRNELAMPSDLSLIWPIEGKVRNLHDLILPARLTWTVHRPDEQPSLVVTDVTSIPTVVKIDGSGQFQVLVNNQAPVLDFIAARIVGKGSVGFTLTLQEPPGAKPQELATPVDFNMQCSVTMTTEPASGLRLGDKATYAITLRKPLTNTEIALCAVEQDAKDSGGGSDVLAWTHRLPKNTSSDCAWTIGFTDESGWFSSHFSYSEKFEEGNFEYGWELRAKSLLLPQEHEPFVILASKEPLGVTKPNLTEFHVTAVDYSDGTWRAAGKIEGFSPNCPRVRAALKLVDRAGNKYPAANEDAPTVVIGKDGKFDQVITGPKVPPPAPGEAPPAEVFAILSLLPTWTSQAKVNPISGFLGYAKEKFALCDDAGKPSWDLTCGWICSEESLGIAPRPQEQRKSHENIPAPGPEAFGDPMSELTMDEALIDAIAWEGKVPHMYLDNGGLVTVGIGYLLAGKKNKTNTSKAEKLDFMNRDAIPPHKAEPEEIRKAFKNVLNMAPAMKPPDKYITQPRLELEETYMRQLVIDYVTKSLSNLRRDFDDFDTYPKCVRRSLLDITYNCGQDFFRKATVKNKAFCPKMREAIINRKWDVASTEVPPQGVGRKQWRKDLLMYAMTLKDPTKAPQS
jgi:GH24 family phage-related lysozyme (muramidase)